VRCPASPLSATSQLDPDRREPPALGSDAAPATSTDIGNMTARIDICSLPAL
jgi:hypothetical protein